MNKGFRIRGRPFLSWHMSLWFSSLLSPYCDFYIFFLLGLVIAFPQLRIVMRMPGRAPRQMAVSCSGTGDHAHCPIRDKQSGRDFLICFFPNRDAFQTLATCYNSVRKFVWSRCPASCYIPSSKCNQGWSATFSKHSRPEGKGEPSCSIKPCHLILLFCCQSFGVTGRKTVGVFCLWGSVAVYSPTTGSSHPETCLWVLGCYDTPFRPPSSLPRLSRHHSHSPRVQL